MRWTGEAGAVIGIDRYGLSAPGEDVATALGINTEAIIAAARDIVARQREEEYIRD
jgi:transketolase